MIVVVVALLCAAQEPPPFDPAEPPPPVVAPATADERADEDDGARVAPVPDALPGAGVDVDEQDEAAPASAPRRRTGLLDDDGLVLIGAGATTTLAATVGYGVGWLAAFAVAVVGSSFGSNALLAAFVVPSIGAAVGGLGGAFLFTADPWAAAPALVAGVGTLVGLSGVFLFSGALYNPLAGLVILVGMPAAALIGAGAVTSGIVAWRRASPIDDE